MNRGPGCKGESEQLPLAAQRSIAGEAMAGLRRRTDATRCNDRRRATATCGRPQGGGIRGYIPYNPLIHTAWGPSAARALQQRARPQGRPPDYSSAAR